MDQSDTQQPIPTTDAKEIAGPSCSTRSKVKRTSHSVLEGDNDSSAPQSHQPPVKRRTKEDAKQGDSYSSAEVALENDLVLESLLRYMNQRDLLKCRIVNKQWQYEGTKELRRRKLVIRISFGPQINQMTRDDAFRDICRRLSECRSPSLLSSFEVKTNSHNYLGSEGPIRIFTTVGNQLKHLTLHLNYCDRTSSFERSFLMTHLQNLLFRQAPNLEFLEIKFDLDYRWAKKLEAWDSAKHHVNDNIEFGLLPNLKTFLVSGAPPQKFLADVMKAAVSVISFGGAWPAWSKYLMEAEGGGKIHQFKTLQLGVHSRHQWNTHDLELMEAFLTEHKQKLKLESFDCVMGGMAKDPRTVSAINQILGCSTGSLQKLIIQPAGMFVDLLIFPVLPKLKEICLDCHSVTRHDLRGGGFFPCGFNMNYTFPNVSSIVLLYCDKALFRRFARRVGIELTAPVPSMRYIVLDDKGFKGDFVPPIATVMDFRWVFPNLVSLSYVDNQKYYQIIK